MPVPSGLLNADLPTGTDPVGISTGSGHYTAGTYILGHNTENSVNVGLVSRFLDGKRHTVGQ